MSSPIEQQELFLSIGASISGNIPTVALSSTQKEDDDGDLATQTASLGLKDPNGGSILSNETTDKTSPDETSTCKAIDENISPKPLHATAVAPINNTQTDQGTTSEVTADTAGPKKDTATSPNQPNEDEDDDEDETSTPRFATYIKLHNDVRPPTHQPSALPLPNRYSQMMNSKTALTSHATEQLELYHRASHIARTLLVSHEKHADLPLVMHAHACLVLGCSDEDDCYERMEEALVLINHAMDEGVLDRMQGEEMVKTCELVMGMRGQTLAVSDEEESEGSEQGDGDEGKGDGQKESESRNEGKDEDADDNEHIESNDALP